MRCGNWRKSPRFSTLVDAGQPKQRPKRADRREIGQIVLALQRRARTVDLGAAAKQTAVLDVKAIGLVEPDHAARSPTLARSSSLAKLQIGYVRVAQAQDPQLIVIVLLDAAMPGRMLREQIGDDHDSLARAQDRQPDRTKAR